MVAFAIALHLIGEPNAFAVFTAAAALIFTIALVQDTFRMAFRDELTGLPSRRDLNERMMGLGRRYTIAMCDVDHFKKFNDTHGHDLGDQVLKIVAAKLGAVSGGGTAYRYGGEEFTVLFPGKDIEHATPHLEALREAIEAYKIALRAPNRPDKAEPATRRRGAFRDDEIGVGHHQHRRGGTQREARHARRRHQGGGPGALSREEKGPQPGEQITACAIRA